MSGGLGRVLKAQLLSSPILMKTGWFLYAYYRTRKRFLLAPYQKFDFRNYVEDIFVYSEPLLMFLPPELKNSLRDTAFDLRAFEGDPETFKSMKFYQNYFKKVADTKWKIRVNHLFELIAPRNF